MRDEIAAGNPKVVKTSALAITYGPVVDKGVRRITQTKLPIRARDDHGNPNVSGEGVRLVLLERLLRRRPARIARKMYSDSGAKVWSWER
jgi:hypothetical protein